MRGRPQYTCPGFTAGKLYQLTMIASETANIIDDDGHFRTVVLTGGHPTGKWEPLPDMTPNEEKLIEAALRYATAVLEERKPKPRFYLAEGWTIRDRETQQNGLDRFVCSAVPAERCRDMNNPAHTAEWICKQLNKATASR